MLKRTVAFLALSAAMPAMAGDLSDAGLADPVVTPGGTRYTQPEECTIRLFGLTLPCDNSSRRGREALVAQGEDGDLVRGPGGTLVSPDLDGPRPDVDGDAGPEEGGGDDPEGDNSSSDPGESGGPGDNGGDGPDTDGPGTDDPDTDGPDTDGPGTDDPDTDGPGTDDPDTDGPDTDGPGTDDPDTDGPDTDGPGTDDPETEGPEEEPDTSAPRGRGNKGNRLEELGLNRDWQDNSPDVVDAIRDHHETGEPWSDFDL